MPVMQHQSATLSISLWIPRQVRPLRKVFGSTANSTPFSLQAGNRSSLFCSNVSRLGGFSVDVLACLKAARLYFIMSVARSDWRIMSISGHDQL